MPCRRHHPLLLRPHALLLLAVGAPAHAASELNHLVDAFTITRGPDGIGLIAADGSGARIRENIVLAQPPSVEIDFEASTWHEALLAENPGQVAVQVAAGSGGANRWATPAITR